MSEQVSMAELEARRSVLLAQLRRAGPLVEGSIAVTHSRCGTPNCQCVRGGPKHRSVKLCRKVDGRSHATYVPKDLEDTVREWNEEHKRVKQLLKDISEISEQIIRGYVSSRRGRTGQGELRLVRPDSSGSAGGRQQ